MNPDRLRALLERVARGELDADGAFEAVKHLPFEDLGFAKVDHHRALRRACRRSSSAPGKTADQVIAIARSLRASGHDVLITRLAADVAAVVTAALPEISYDADARLALLRAIAPPPPRGRGTILVGRGRHQRSAGGRGGGGDRRAHGQPVERIYDVGVAGLHRLLRRTASACSAASVLIVVAGMEGALPSVVGGLVDRPVIAVPTSIGYGASFGGLAALLAHAQLLRQPASPWSTSTTASAPASPPA